MFSVHVNKSARTGNPEVWAYDDTPSCTPIIFGSLLTGGLKHQTMPPAYGINKVTEKLRKGYILVTRHATEQDIELAKIAVQGSLNKIGQQPFDIYAAAMKISGKPINANLLWPKHDVSNDNSVASAIPTVLKTNSSPIFPSAFPSNGESNAAWAW